MLREISQAQRDNCYMMTRILVESKKVDLIECESRVVVPNGWGEEAGGRDREKLIHGYKVTVR